LLHPSGELSFVELVGFSHVEALGFDRKGTGVGKAPSKKTSLRWPLKEATGRNQPWPGVDDRHYGARDDSG
jgi:hypothetical protein